jgi:hypothetical protein
VDLAVHQELVQILMEAVNSIKDWRKRAMFVSVYMVKETLANGDDGGYSEDSVIVDTLEEVDKVIGEIQLSLDEEGKESNSELKIVKVETYNLAKLKPSATKEF